MTQRGLKLAFLLSLTGLLHACASTPFNYQQYLRGQWDTIVNGYPVVVEYTEATVGIVGFPDPVPYALAGNRITFEFQGTQTNTIEVINDDEMNQLNDGTQQITQFVRRK